MICASATKVWSIDVCLINVAPSNELDGSFSPATVNVFENILLLGSLLLAMVTLYVSGVESI